MVKIHYLICIYEETKKLQRFINWLRSKKYNNTTPHIREIRFFDIAVNTKDVKPFETDLKAMLNKYNDSNRQDYKKMINKLDSVSNLFLKNTPYKTKDLTKVDCNNNFYDEIPYNSACSFVKLFGIKKDNYKNWSD